ncbi:PREDICTED: uncharacterized protein LOC105569888 [Vollenhovia emeryi]|uniref:uncharacterized protein LOC105569888 n=1 Tax=Vollenhovia emeryi TaxID=411798 RepID=UPI0005F3B871|nr:PREDICTED: uncharacterized protein LOC105569888 [Vollenhovia emeryi]XP_011882084.1 PREDICTED: uncharacterized protein LOC105569888 [Vollenhovia emeryi]
MPKDRTCRSSRPRKRVFGGNQFKKVDGAPTGESTSARQLGIAQSEEIPLYQSHCYKILDFITVFTALSDLLVCKECKQRVSFAQSDNRGLGFKILLSCLCGRRQIYSSTFINNSYEINRRIVFVMRLLGVSREGINLFCSLMDLGKGIGKNSYYVILRHIYDASKIVFLLLRKKAMKEEQAENEKKERDLSNLKVSSDSSWQKHGFSSLYAVSTLVGYYSGKVIDLVIKGSYCQACILWKSKEGTDEYLEWAEAHENECCINHDCSSGKMEVDSIKEMFARSEEEFGVKYGNYIGDGDSKTFNGILDLNPYTDDFTVVVNECVEHVENRMSTQLRNLKEREKLGEKLTDALIKRLTTYYGLAVRRNVDSVDDMKKEIMATYKHLCSTNENPMHENCPPGVQSWCKWHVAEATGATFDHPAPLHPDLQKHLLPLYEDLSKNELVQRYLGGHTQNVTESFNSCVWRLAPKHLYCGIQTVEIAAYIAAGLFNEGYFAVLKIMDTLQLKIGSHCIEYADSYDTARIQRHGRRDFRSSKEGRATRKEINLQEQQLYEDEEDLLYGPGIID